MLSNHYPAIYNHENNWLLLMLLAVSGAFLRHAMVTKNPRERWTLLPASVGLAALVFITSATAKSIPLAQPVEFSQVNSIIQNRCVSCHSARPTDDIFTTAPKGILLDQPEEIKALMHDIYEHVVHVKTMPLGNKTQMTDEERAVIGAWIQQNGLYNSNFETL
jgi:uncharacterized membrane protein